MKIQVAVNTRVNLWMIPAFLIAVGILTIPFALALHFGHTLTFPSSSNRTGFQSSPSTRGTLNIVWSCLSTIIACVYVALHPDIPWKSEGAWMRGISRVLMLIVGASMPEAIIGQAAWEYAHAYGYTRAIRDAKRESVVKKLESASALRGDTGSDLEYHTLLASEKQMVKVPSSRSWWKALLPCFGNDDEDITSRWTMTHALFTDMGGFECDRCHEELKLDTFLALQRTGQLDDIWDNLDVILRSINDKSKADPLVKTLVCLQISWFVVNTIARQITKLPISQLELVTCGYVACGLGTYALWWHKPYNVTETITLSLKNCDKCNIYIDTLKDTKQTQSAAIAILTGTLVFGTCHILSWNDIFINSSGQLLWRISSITMTSIPIVLMFLLWLENAENRQALSIRILYVALFILYGATRVTLVMLLVLSFWNLPADVYLETDWASIWPSIR